MSTACDVSFILPCYNVEKYIEACVASIESQNLKTQGFSYEILLLNDCSTDNTELCINSITAQNPHCTAVHFDKNRGVSGVRNYAIECAHGEYVWFVDPDGLLYPQSAGFLIKTAKRYRADKCFGNYYEVSVGEDLHSLPIYTPDTVTVLHGENSIFPTVNQHGAKAASTCTGVWKRKFLLENQLLFNKDVQMTEDLLFNFQCEYIERYVVKVECPCYIYRVGHTSATTSKGTAAQKRNFESGKKLTEIYSSYLPVDNSEKLKRRIDQKAQDTISSLVSIPDTPYVKQQLNLLKAEGFFPVKLYYQDNCADKSTAQKVRYYLLDNPANSLHFWILHYFRKWLTFIKERNAK